MIQLVTLRKLDQDDRIYYYLEHPVKVNGRVKKYSKYLGRDLPMDLESVKEQFLEEIARTRWNELSLKAKEKMATTTENLAKGDLDKYYHESALRLTTNSLRISGSKITLLELRRLIEETKAPTGRSKKDIIEAKNHYSILSNIFRDSQKLSLSLMVDWHWKLFRETLPITAGVLRTDGQALSDEKYPMKLDSHHFHLTENVNPLRFAGSVHFNLCRDRIFHNGNEIVARLAMNCILIQFGFPTLDIEFSERKRYEDALGKSIKNDGDSAFLAWFFLKYSRKLEIHFERV